ncbi:MAG: molecular chaperone HtpG [Candidatus Auribacter fodinae]|jgi:molecular chaperone HtpG|uniref:Chaperone protein HtpG n=1 Tax=Candidatus Auribacter fodinae TaxID=2093366 RepID=A0A3A4R5X9_9BACT|nr:MAG: molecular chaperone HtpG [Candidatus Auribacter fodinae]
MERYEFQAETKQLLDLMVHSIYSNKDIFLRELISNSSDALDKLRYQQLTDTSLEPDSGEPAIRIEADKKARTVRVIDNGIGMSKDDVIGYVGTIAKSGTKEFLNVLQKNKDKALSPELIGQFGVGLYSCFMVADKIVIETRKAGENKGLRWESTGDGTYTIEDIEQEPVGTAITLHLKATDAEDGLFDYTDEWKIREIVRKYSDYISYPIRMQVERTEYEQNENGEVKPGAKSKTVVKDETLNSIKAIWTRSPEEVPDEEYNEFYKHISHDWTDPMDRIAFKAEGTFEFRGLLFIPSRAQHDLFYRDSTQGIHLYIRRVFIMSDCKELIPEYLRFMRGVVDSEDLSLNISREILQQNRQIQVIRNKVTAKVLEKLADMKEKDADKYTLFWNEFGKVLKEGLINDIKNRDKLLDLLMVESTADAEKRTTLAEYVSRMKQGQDKIYYMNGRSRDAIENSPHLEAFRDKGYEVILLTDAVDELWVQAALEYDKKQLVSVGKGTVDLGSEEEQKKEKKELEEQKEHFKSLLEFLKNKLSEHVKEVRLSKRLTSSPVCLVGEATDMTPQMEELMRSMGQDIPKTKRILEVNPGHPIFQKMQERFDKDRSDPVLGEYSELLYGQALLAEGNQPPDPGKFSKAVADLMARALNG